MDHPMGEEVEDIVGFFPGKPVALGHSVDPKGKERAAEHHEGMDVSA